MTESNIRSLLEGRAEAKGTTLAALSKAAGKNHAYLQQFVKRGTPRSLPEDVREIIAPLLDLTADELRSKTRPSAAGSDLIEMLAEDKTQGKASSDATALKTVPGRTSDGDMTLYRFAHAGRGNLILEEIPFETVTRPDYLARVREPYGVMVDGDSMIPEFHAGWIAEINPNLAPRKEDTCIFRGETVDGGYWAALKVYVREDETHWHVRQHNPRKSYKLKKSEFQIAHVVVGSDRRRR